MPNIRSQLNFNFISSSFAIRLKSCLMIYRFNFLYLSVHSCSIHRVLFTYDHDDIFHVRGLILQVTQSFRINHQNEISTRFRFRFRSTTLNFYIVFPFILNSITLAGLYYLPKRMRLWESIPDIDDENSELLKKIGGFKKRRLQSKQKN